MPDNSAKTLLTLDRVNKSTFSGTSIQFETPVIFGGQLLAQVLFAAANTISSKCPANHLNAQFLSYGDPGKPLKFHVRVLKDGKSTNVRQVEVTQEDRLLMLGTVTFAQGSAGYEFHSAMPDRPLPGALPGEDNLRFSLTADEDAFPFIMAACPATMETASNSSSIWVRSLIEADDSLLWQQMLFAFISDATILQSALRPHGLVFGDPGLVVATMNHTIWFHRTLKMQDWTLIHSDCPSTGAGRAVSLAHAFSGAGELQCTVVQEGVLKGSVSNSQQNATSLKYDDSPS